MDAIRRLLGSQNQTVETPAGSTFLLVGLGNPGRQYRENRHKVSGGEKAETGGRGRRAGADGEAI